MPEGTIRWVDDELHDAGLAGRNRWWWIAGAVALAAAVVVLATTTEVFATLTDADRFRVWLDGLGAWGPVLFVVGMVVFVSLGVPGVPFVVAAGVVWPNGLAFVLSMLGGLGSSTVGFVVARRAGRDAVEPRLSPRLRRWDARLSEGGVWPVILIRFVGYLAAPFDWVLGLSRVRYRAFLIGTAIGLVPQTILLLVLGEGAFELLADASPAVAAGVVAALALAIVGGILWLRRRNPSAVDHVGKF